MNLMQPLLQRAQYWYLSIALICLLAACASVPSSIQSLNWHDLWGGRSQQAAYRDWEMCTRLVEQRRGLLASCMAGRGWGEVESFVITP